MSDETTGPPPDLSPRAEYERRLSARDEVVARAARLDDRLSLARGLVFLAAVALAIAALSVPAVSWWWVMLPAAGFVVLVVVHGAVLRRLARARAAVEYYRTALERLEHRWAGIGPGGERYLESAHPYAADLDLFGRASLFQLLCRARTRLGEDRLAAWLLESAGIETLRERQAAVTELRGRLDLREALALLDAEVHDHLDQNGLLRWSAEPSLPVHPARRIAAVVIALAILGTLVGWLLGLRLAFLLMALIAQSVATLTFRRNLRHATTALDEAGSGLAILAQVLELIEAERFASPRLAGLRGRLETDGEPPSAHIHRLRRRIQSLHNSLDNQFFAPIAFALGLPVHLVHSIERWRQRAGAHIPDWLEAVGEFEALVSLAGYAYENPGDPFPELVAEAPLLDGAALGHPLLPEATCVRNDVRLDGTLKLLLVSGSNMSGKSTLLRTVGVNAVLALAGAPVRAARLRLSRLAVGTEMRVADSLQDGRSLFYSVVSRLKSIVDLAGREPPLLFLLDEILPGTNSHDRRRGAEGVIRKLVESGAIGLVTTHDLALTEIVNALGERAVNVHFEDRLVDGVMTFDYRLRPGVIQRTNALELMRMIGLEV
jgi:MutS domain V